MELLEPNLQDRMRALGTAAIVAVVCAGCAVPPHGEPTGERRVSFACSNGEEVEMRFFPAQGVAVLVRNARTIELQQQPAASGFVYSNGPNTVRGKGKELTVEIGRMVPFQCYAR